MAAKGCGDQGLCRFGDINLALLTELAWKLLSGDNAAQAAALWEKDTRRQFWDVEKRSSDSVCRSYGKEFQRLVISSLGMQWTLWGVVALIMYGREHKYHFFRAESQSCLQSTAGEGARAINSSHRVLNKERFWLLYRKWQVLWKSRLYKCLKLLQ